MRPLPRARPPRRWLIRSRANQQVRGTYEGSKVLVLGRTSQGEVDFSAFTYLRYLNQRMLDDSYTDAFGRTKDIDIREDLQLQKVMLFFKGWLFDPNFRYQFYAWTSNTTRGRARRWSWPETSATASTMPSAWRVALAACPAPGPRTTPFPTGSRWIIGRSPMNSSVPPTPLASPWGEVADGVRYRVMVGNNLSQLGVDAGKLDSGLNAYSGAVWWMPTTGEYGPGEGFGDFEHHTGVRHAGGRQLHAQPRRRARASRGWMTSGTVRSVCRTAP